MDVLEQDGRGKTSNQTSSISIPGVCTAISGMDVAIAGSVLVRTR